ncbi:hypothetical protein TNCV_2026161 [Trichonephila clavipes]|nr:hypothetical protein TNCV_2026161 [Trichonephila clavipes]
MAPTTEDNERSGRLICNIKNRSGSLYINGIIIIEWVSQSLMLLLESWFFPKAGGFDFRRTRPCTINRGWSSEVSSEMTT